MVKIVTAPEEYVLGDNDIGCFLAGGITGCHDWQSTVIEELKAIDEDNLRCRNKLYNQIFFKTLRRASSSYFDLEDYNLVIFNPRRENFPIDDPEEAEKQIKWEFNNLEKSRIFSMYFCAGESDQPICMYELGRRLACMSTYSSNPEDSIIISVEKGYKRTKDVQIQSKLAIPTMNIDDILYGDSGDLEYAHAFGIYSAYYIAAKKLYSITLNEEDEEYDDKDNDYDYNDDY